MTGQGDDGAVFAAVDVHYLRSCAARAALILAGDAAFSSVLAEKTALVQRGAVPVRAVLPPRATPLRAVLARVSGSAC